MELNKTLLVHSLWGCKTTKHVKSVLNKHKIACKVVHRSVVAKADFSGADLVFAVGGDGTLLRACHFILDKTPVMGINCNLNVNEGFFMRANKQNFKERLALLVKGRHKILSLSRLKVQLNKQPIKELALNEVFLGDRRIHHTSRYWLGSEYQKSSGVIVAAPAGTHAWYRTAGGKPLPLTSKRFAYIVREPYRGRLVNPRHTHGILRQNQKLAIKSDIFDGILVLDGVSRAYKFCCKDRAVVSISDRPLSLVSF